MKSVKQEKKVNECDMRRHIMKKNNTNEQKTQAVNVILKHIKM